MSASAPENLRVLLVDDNPAIHNDYRRILDPRVGTEDLDADAAALFGGSDSSGAAAPPKVASFELFFAFQGQDALAMVKSACAEGRPYALAFVDMRMPPGWDGLETIVRLWEVDPELHVVICTAHSDHSWEQIQTALPVRERWLVLKKPFDKIEVLQLAHALTEKWQLTRVATAQRATIERMVKERTEELRRDLEMRSERLASVSRLLLSSNLDDGTVAQFTKVLSGSNGAAG